MLDLLAANWVMVLGLCLVADMPLLFALLYFMQQRRVRAAEHWSVTLGEIVASEVRAHTGRRGNVSYTPLIVYEYEVTGQRYRGERVNFGLGMASGVRSWAEEKVTQYAVGSRVEVYYDPGDPANAVLEKQASMSKSVRYVALFTVLGSAIALLVILLTFTLLNTPS
ncbi:MAG: DUF3592 domain-containing protein [Anaerolineae bacterium]